MKKLKYLIFSLLLIIPLCVFAAEQPKVTKLETNVEGKNISYNGTMETGSHAVMCKLYSDSTEINKISLPVDSGKFNGSFTVTEIGEYKISCANYEGGAIKEVTATVADAKEEIKEITIKFTKPEIGTEVKKNDVGMPSVKATFTANNTKVTVGGYFTKTLATDDDLEPELFFGTFEADKEYYLLVDLYLGPEAADYVFANDLKVSVEGVDDYKLSTNSSETYKNVFASFKLTNEENPTEEVEVEEKSEQDSPKTGDHFVIYITILVIGILGVITSILFFKKKQIN